MYKMWEGGKQEDERVSACHSTSKACHVHTLSWTSYIPPARCRSRSRDREIHGSFSFAPTTVKPVDHYELKSRNGPDGNHQPLPFTPRNYFLENDVGCPSPTQPVSVDDAPGGNISSMMTLSYAMEREKIQDGGR